MLSFPPTRPAGDNQWFSRSNPEGTPEPLIESGECKVLSKEVTTETDSVECDVDGYGTMSPSLHKIDSGAGLIDWWISVGDPSSEFYDGDESGHGHADEASAGGQGVHGEL